MARSATDNARNDAGSVLSRKTSTVRTGVGPSSTPPRRKTNNCSPSKEPGKSSTARPCSGSLCCTVSRSAPALDISIRRTFQRRHAAAVHIPAALPLALASNHGNAKFSAENKIDAAVAAWASAASSNSRRRRLEGRIRTASAIDGGKAASGISRVASGSAERD